MKASRGISLIEVLVYLGIFSILMNGLISSFYFLELTRDSLGTEAQLHDEGFWVLETVRHAYERDNLIPSLSSIRSLVPHDEVTVGTVTTIPHVLKDGGKTGIDIQFDLHILDSGGHPHTGIFYETLMRPL